MARTLLTGILCFVILSPTLGKVINVPVGADSNALQAVMNKANPGDTIRLGAGTYRLETTVNVTRGGTDKKPLIIEGAGADKTIIKGSVLVKNWQADKPGVWKLAGVRVNSQQLFADGQPLQQIGIQNTFQKSGEYESKALLPPVGMGLEDLVPGSFFYDSVAQVLYCMLADRSDPNKHVMEASIVPGQLLLAKGVSHVVLRKIGFMHNNASAANRLLGLVTVASSTNWTIEDCVMNYGDGGGITLVAHDSVIRRCDFSHNGIVGVGMSGNWEEFPNVPAGVRKVKYAGIAPQNVVLEDSTINYNNYRNFNRAWHGGGMKLIPGIKAVTVRNCQVTYNNGAGIWFDGALGNNQVLDNFTAYNNGAGIFYEISNKDEGDEYGVLIRNNRVIKNKSQGIYIAGSSDAIVENNTCYGNLYNILLHGMPRRDWGWDLPLKDNRVENNIVGSPTLGDIALFVGANSMDNIIRNNFFELRPVSKIYMLGLIQVDNDPKKYEIFNLGQRDDLKRAHELGLAEGAKVANPRWVNPIKDDFHLKPGSPAEGMGWQDKPVTSQP
ncbi:MAG: right-handed parallel beta-helix repeat-containing protein [Phycisphaerales bacterium]|nr:right-handed parallel beta-helix repeat-containing protein [Phycisphaerales bacterium]